ncbi:hypothetical protein NQT69_07510 [Pseudoalteromonas shioyasakiensis]|uniref:hypothetical protein n=1 Tax=Pseudoalteromonas shioyasakiensis TaxID=1190813 RepID=UPI002117BC42|nr:hypothetical protein [Pseudoalteromonas shioyasakiensis]MCQ8877843.1 hypothetical protein [Pseudoalteromonas shioyasakiensis]
MQFIKRLLKAFFYLALLAIVAFSLFSLSLWLKSAEPVDTRSDDETRSNVQWLSTEKPLVYALSPSRTHSIRVLSNAIFEQQLALDKPINYAIEYSLLDKENKALSTSTYHHASKLTPVDNELQIKQIIEKQKALLVSSGQSFYISPEQITDVSAISLKLIPENPQVMGVVVRVHAKTINDSIDTNAAWLKLPLDKRERATNYLSLGTNALSNNEMSNAVAYRWLKLAPQGIPSIDFKSDILYETLPYNVVTYDFSQQQLNLDDYYTDENLCASITLEQPDRLQFSKSNNTPINIVWYDLNQFIPPKTVNYEENNTSLNFITEPLNAGLVTICSSQGVLTNWSLQSKQPLLTSQDSFYQIDSATPAIYTIDSNSDISIELRAARNSEATVKVYDKNKREIDKFSVFYDGETSQFDRIILDTTQRQLTKKAKALFLRVGENAARLEVTTNQTALVRVKSRNSQFHYQRSVCHTTCTQSLDFYNIAAWYEQQADNHYSFTENDAYINIRVFAEPPEVIIEDTFYQSRELFSVLPISNVALVNSPDKYYAPLTEPTPFNFAKINAKQLLQLSAHVPDTIAANIVYQQSNNSARDIDFDDTDFEKLAQIEDTAKAVYQNWHGHRPWVKQRLYKLTAGKKLTLTYPQLRPKSVVFKAYSHKAHQNVTITTTQNARYHNGVSSEYSIEKKRLRLQPSALSDAFLIHPKDSSLYAYPAITNQISNDIRAINSITLSSDKTIWIAVLEEYENEEQKIRWWNDETF